MSGPTSEAVTRPEHLCEACDLQLVPPISRLRLAITLIGIAVGAGQRGNDVPSGIAGHSSVSVGVKVEGEGGAIKATATLTVMF